MSLKHLSSTQKEIVAECLAAVVESPFFSQGGDIEEGIWGFEEDAVHDVRRRWPDVTATDELDRAVVSNCLNNLLGGSHGCHEQWDDWISVPKGMVEEVLDRWLRLDVPLSEPQAIAQARQKYPRSVSLNHAEGSIESQHQTDALLEATVSCEWGWVFVLSTPASSNRTCVIVNRWTGLDFAQGLGDREPDDVAAEYEARGLNDWNRGPCMPEIDPTT